VFGVWDWRLRPILLKKSFCRNLTEFFITAFRTQVFGRIRFPEIALVEMWFYKFPAQVQMADFFNSIRPFLPFSC